VSANNVLNRQPRRAFKRLLLFGLLLTLPLVAVAEQSTWKTDSTVGPNSIEITLSLACTGNSLCYFINGYSSTQNPAVTGTGTATLTEGGAWELHLDRQLDVPPVEAWVFDIEPISFDPTALGTPKITSAIFFGISGGPFLVPGLVFGPFGPILISEVLPVGARLDYALEDAEGGIQEITDVVLGPTDEALSALFEMLDATRFEVRDLVVGFSGVDVIDLAVLVPGQPGELTVMTDGEIRLNLSGETVIQFSMGRRNLSWTPLHEATGYDVVRGDLGTLRDSDGNFTLATEECVADNQAGTTLPYTQAPAPSTGHWFLVRAVTPSGNGSYDTAAESQLAARDDAINASPAACP